MLEDRVGHSVEVEQGVTSGDYLSSFLQGTRDALSENGRESMTITVRRLDARSLGALIALYERAVGLYASLVNINACHQPGVEAGKKMAGAIIALQKTLLAYLRQHAGRAFSVDELAAACAGAPETVFHLLEHLSGNKDHRIVRTAGPRNFESRYSSGR